MAYHGSDDFANFPGTTVRSLLGLNAYPTATIDRVTGKQSRSAWNSLITNRIPVAPTVAIELTGKNFNPATRLLDADFKFTALQNLSGQFNYSVILVEDGIVYPQSGSGGGTNYVHDWTVRSMINGDIGEVLVNGAWNQGEELFASITYTVPDQSDPAPAIVPDSCRLVALVYEYGTPLGSNAEIQQAETWSLAPQHAARMVTRSQDVIGNADSSVTFYLYLKNTGELSDQYLVEFGYDGPDGWQCQFTTANGIFDPIQRDTISLSSHDSTQITALLHPRGLDGFGDIGIKFTSLANTSISGSQRFRLVTDSGISTLVISTDNSGHEYAAATSLFNDARPYGIVSREVLESDHQILGRFEDVIWVGADTRPAFLPADTAALKYFLDNGGNLLITGQDIGNDIWDASGFSNFAQDFYTNYLHAGYVSNQSIFLIVNGLSGDPIGDDISFIINSAYAKSPDIIKATGPNSDAIFKFGGGTQYSGIKATDGNHSVVYLSFGLEQIDSQAVRDSVVNRSLRWMRDQVSGMNEITAPVREFRLMQNFPNPFNPQTSISYSIPEKSQVDLIIYNLLGQKIRHLVNNITQSADQHSVIWNGMDKNGKLVPSGVYIYKLNARSGLQNFQQTRKMIFLK